MDCVVVDLNEGVLIPDATTNCFYSNVQVDSAYGTAVVDSSTNLGFFVNMEHSYMGDLIITYTCPNGQSITVHEQGGGGTNLGVPDQGDGTGPGVGWYYAGRLWPPMARGSTIQRMQGFCQRARMNQSIHLLNLLGCQSVVRGHWRCATYGGQMMVTFLNGALILVIANLKQGVPI